MDPLTIAAIANVGGGLLGNMMGSGDRDAATQMAQRGVKAYGDIKIPDPEDMKLFLQQYASAGNLTPEQLQAMQLSSQDQLENVNLDPRLKAAQMDALQFMQKTGQGELTPAERAEVNNLRRQTEADSKARIDAMLQQQDARGVGSSDMALAARLQDAQGSANRAAASTDNINAAAFNRALQSMASGATLAGNMESADYSRQAALAEAERNRELANFSNQQNISNTNVGNRNAAQQFNLQNSQNIANQNTALSNQQQQYNKELQQKQFENQMARAGGISGSAGTASTALAARGQATADNMGNIGRGIGGVAANMNKPETPKTADLKSGTDLNDQLTAFFKNNKKA